MIPVSHELRSIWVGFAEQTKTNLQSRRGAKTNKNVEYMFVVLYAIYERMKVVILNVYKKGFLSNSKHYGAIQIGKGFLPGWQCKNVASIWIKIQMMKGKKLYGISGAICLSVCVCGRTCGWVPW